MSFSESEHNRKILVIDDEADVLEFLTYYLETLSWQVIAVDSTTKAFEKLATEKVFCLLTDIAMPEMDGYEFIAEVKKRNITCEVLLMTGFGYNPDHTLVRLNRHFHYTCLFKPFNRQKLAQAIQNAFDSFHAARAV